MRLVVLLLAGSLGAAPSLEAQPLGVPRLGPYGADLIPALSIDYGTVAVADHEDQGPGIAGPVLLGLAGGVAGGLIGGRVGGSCEDLDCDPGVAYGLLIGESLGLAAGVHLANRSHGGLGKSALVALAIAGGGVAAAALAGRGVVLVAVPILQLAAVIGIERRARANAADDPI